MPSNPHRIRRLQWMVSTDLSAEAFTIRKCLRAQWQELLLLACEKAFDEAAQGENVIHIPKLELRLTVPAGENLIQVLPDLIRQQLKEQLQVLQTEPSHEQSGSDRPSFDRSPLDWQTITPEHSAVDLLLHYLRTGSVPWQVAHVASAEIAIMLRQTCQRQWQHLLDYLHHNSEPEAFYFRLLQLLPETEWLPLVSTLLEPLPVAWGRAVGHIVSAVVAPGQQFFNTYQQRQLIAVFLAEGLQGWTTNRLLDSRVIAVVQIISAVMAPEQQFFSADQQRQLVVAFLVESLRYQDNRIPDSMTILETILGSAEARTIEAFITTLPASVALLVQCYNPGNSSTHSRLSGEAVEPVDERSPSASDAIPHMVDVPQPISGDREINPVLEISLAPVWAIAPVDDAFGLSVHYAGLVLIHSFIPPYLAAVGVEATAENLMVPEVNARAAALLHFLAVGTQAIYEYELGFIKVLLGLKPDTPLLVAEGLLQAGDQDEAETMSQSVIHYWSALKSTSVAGLRASFLQRPGLLRETEDSWHLQVEPQSFDMLLNYLPWAIGIVKFSWMPKPIYTEWLTP